MKNLLHKISMITICLYFISIPLLSYSGESNTYSHLIFAIFVGASIFYIMLSGRFVFSKGYIYYFFILAIIIFSTYWAKYKASTSQAYTTFSLMFLMLMLIVNVINEDYELDKIIKGIVWLSFFYHIYVTAFYGFSGIINAMNVDDGQRLGGDITQSNSFGFLAAMTFLIAFYYAYVEKKKIYYLIMIIPIILAFASGSRKALIVMIIGLFAYILLKRDKNHLKNIFKYTIGFAVVFIILYFLKDNIFAFQRFEKMLDFFKGDVQADSSIRMRFEMIGSGLEWFMERPFFGHGSNQYNYLYYLNFGAYRPSHNNMIQMLVDYGIVGFTIYYGLYIYIFKRLIKLYKKGEKLSILMLVIFLGLFISGFSAVVLFDKISTIYIAFLLVYVGIHDLSEKNSGNLKSLKHS